MFFPLAVTMTFFLRPVMWRKPSLSMNPRSPGVEPSVYDDLGGKLGRFVVSEHDIFTLEADVPGAVLGGIDDFKSCVRCGKSGGAVAVELVAVDGCERCALGKTVSLNRKNTEIAQSLQYGRDRPRHRRRSSF